MAELSTLARPYAKAAFEYAAQNQCIGPWADMLSLAAAVSMQDKVAQLLASPSISTEQQVSTLCDLCAESLDDKGVNLMSVLGRNKRLSLLPQISQQFQDLQAEQLQVVEVELSSAFAVTDQQRDTLAEKLRQTLKRDINIKTTIDQDLIGGVHIRAGDLVIDGSVRGKLAKLAEVLNQ